MSLHKRFFSHRMFKARQISPANSPAGGGFPGFQGNNPSSSSDASTPTNTPAVAADPKHGPGNNNNNNSGNGNKNSATSDASTPTPATQASQSASQTQPSNTPANTPQSTSSTSAAATPTSSSSALPSSSSSSSASSVSSTSSISKIISTSSTSNSLTRTPVVTGPSGSSTLVFSASTGALTPSSSASASNSSSGSGTSVGVIVGAVAGGLIGLIILLAAGSWVMRWWSRHTAERDFVDEYNTTSADANDDFGPSMTQHNSSPSFGGSAGLAGQGVTASRATAMGGPGAYSAGSGYPSTVDDESIGGVYSSQPQAQAPYNPESYGQYVPYNAPAAAGGYQEAMRGYQGQRGYEPPVNFGYAISESAVPQPPAPAPVHTSQRSSPPPRTTAAAALAAAHAAAGASVSGVEPRRSAAYTEDDAYGGF